MAAEMDISIIERIHRLEADINELNSLKSKWEIESITQDIAKQWAIRYGIFECIQIIIDCSCHLVSKLNLGNPQTYLDCLIYLKNYNYITDDLFNELKPIIGLRNIIVHDYIDISVEKLFISLNDMKPFQSFASSLLQVFESV